MRKPQKQVLLIWRIALILATLVPAFLNSLFFRTGGLVWICITLLWVLSFLFFYLFYLPVRYRKFAYSVKDNQIIVHSGVFYNRVRVMPIAHIQFTSLYVSPLDAIWGLSSLVAVAPGGRLVIPGLRREDAEQLVTMLPEGWQDKSGD